LTQRKEGRKGGQGPKDKVPALIDTYLVSPRGEEAESDRYLEV